MSVFSTSQAQNAAPSGTPEQLAAGIAQTMRATNPSSPSGPLSQEITSQGNIVESRMTIRDAAAFQKVKAQNGARQLTLTRFMCRPERLAYMTKGVVFRYVIVGPSPLDNSEFTIDKRSCASLTETVDTDAATLTRLAEGVAQRLRTTLTRDSAQSGFLHKSVVVREGIVQVVDVVTAPALIERFERESPTMRGLVQGWFCGESEDAVRKGVKIDVVYKRADGSILLETLIDDTVC